VRVAVMGAWGVACGTAVHAELLVREWRLAGHEVLVLAGQEAGASPSRTAEDGPLVRRCFVVDRAPVKGLTELWLDASALLEEGYLEHGAPDPRLGLPIVIAQSRYTEDLGEEVLRFRELDQLEACVEAVFSGHQPSREAQQRFLAERGSGRVAAAFIELFEQLGRGRPSSLSSSTLGLAQSFPECSSPRAGECSSGISE
jgi:hypothetical protein